MWAYIAGLLWGLAAGITLVVGFRMMHAGTGLYLIALVWTSVIAISCAFLRWSISSSKTPTNEVAYSARALALNFMPGCWWGSLVRGRWR